MGIQVSSTRPQLYGEALVRSGIVGKIKEVHTFSNKSWGDDKPLPKAIDPVPAPLDWDDWLGVSAPRPFIRGVYHPGEWRRRIGFGTGTLGDMGCHIYSPPYRALKLTSPISVTAVRAGANGGKLGDQGAGEADLSRDRVHRRRHGRRVVVRRRRAAAGRDSRAGRRALPAAGQRRRRHRRDAGAAARQRSRLRVPDAKRRRCRRSTCPSAITTREFIDVVLGGGKTKCSANFDYAGPLTESVLIGNVAAHFPARPWRSMPSRCRSRSGRRPTST